MEDRVSSINKFFDVFFNSSMALLHALRQTTSSSMYSSILQWRFFMHFVNQQVLRCYVFNQQVLPSIHQYLNARFELVALLHALRQSTSSTKYSPIPECKI
uniref:Uncharacterized protein n=1 Tax=Anopheles funestus TaxID=62324 RepID=A0A182S2Q2_ANOFN